MKMNIAQATKSIIKNKIKKVIFKAIKPYLPFVLLIVVIILLLATLLDTLFIQGVQADNYSMSESELILKNKCIEKAKVINTCNNFADGISTNYLLDVNNLEENKQIEWSHLYVLMTIESLKRDDISENDLLEQISNSFISTFKYETNTITTETKNTSEDGKETWTTTGTETEYILIESNTIMRSLYI